MPVIGFSPEMRKKPVCGVLAVAVCAQVDFQRAMQAGRDTMPAFRKRFTGVTYDGQIQQMLVSLCCSFSYCEFPRPINLRNWIKRCAKPNTRYLVIVTGHAVSVLNGQVTDQGGTNDISTFWAAGKQVKQVLEIIK